LAVVSPVAAYAEVLFSVHMVQHLLLTMVAAPLLLWAEPVRLARRTAGPQARRRLAATLRSGAVRGVTFPPVTWAVFLLVMWGTHFSGLYQGALETEALHVLEHGMYLAGGLLFWFPVLAAEPSRWRLGPGARLLYLFLAMPANAFLALAIFQADRPLYAAYADPPAWAASALADQRAAAALMWVVGGLAMLAAILLVAGAWAHRERGSNRAAPRSPVRLTSALPDEADDHHGEQDQRGHQHPDPVGQPKGHGQAGGPEEHRPDAVGRELPEGLSGGVSRPDLRPVLKHPRPPGLGEEVHRDEQGGQHHEP
jgi:cytochrome c oxidase assembly factor CtaG